MISLKVIFIIIFLHFISDFVLQAKKMSLNKWKSKKWLGIHSIVYSILFLYFGILFSLITGILHFSVDFITSKITHYLWEKKKVYLFFVVIGLDQAIHFCLLLLTYKYIF